MDKCPCKGCTPPKRTLTCHDTCQLYKAWKHPLREYNKKLSAEHDADDFAQESYRKRKNKSGLSK